MFYTAKQLNRERKCESNTGEMITNPAGYIPTKRRVEDYMRAGANLRAYRESISDFDSAELAEEASSDPTREPGFDPADAHRLEQEAAQRLQRRSKAKEQAAEQSPADGPSAEPEPSAPQTPSEPSTQPDPTQLAQT